MGNHKWISALGKIMKKLILDVIINILGRFINTSQHGKLVSSNSLYFILKILKIKLKD